MKITPLQIEGAATIEPEIHRDERGSFLRLRCTEEFAAAGLPTAFVQNSLSHTVEAHVLRGMHFQLPPSREDKLVRCIRGRIYDVIVDLRPGSRSYLQHAAVELSGAALNALFVPSGCAHGYVTLEPDCYVLYEMTDYYRPELARGVRWNDPAFGIRWPVANPTGSARDFGYPDFDPESVRAFGSV